MDHWYLSTPLIVLYSYLSMGMVLGIYLTYPHQQATTGGNKISLVNVWDDIISIGRVSCLWGIGVIIAAIIISCAPNPGEEGE